MSGRWVGLSYDGPVVTGWGCVAKTEAEALNMINKLRNEEVVPDER